MTDRPRETVSERVKNWTTVFAFLVAGIWGGWLFYYQQFVAPRAAPVNVTTELRVEDAGQFEGEGGRLQAIQLTMTATNPSTRVVYLLPSYWTATGMRVDAQPAAPWTESLPDQLSQRRDMRAGRYFALSEPELVAASMAFSDELLQPGERVSRSAVFYVPADRFDLVHVRTIVPSTREANAVEVSFTYDERGLAPRTFALGPDGVRTEVTNDGSFAYEAYGLQWSTSAQQLALQRSSANGRP